jgi:hypothetical protein
MPRRGARRLAIMLLGGLPAVVLAATETVAQLQGRFDREANSVRKAKLLERLGDAQMEQTRQASQANDFSTVDSVMEKYRDNVRAAAEALKKEHPNAERHTNGYKQLQIHVHKSIRELDEMLVVAPSEYRPPLDLVRRDLAAMDDDLLKLLFPPPRFDNKTPGRNTTSPPGPRPPLASENYT